MEREGFLIIHARRTYVAESAGGEKPAGKALFRAFAHTVVVRWVDIAASREKAAVAAVKGESREIGAPVGRYGEFQAQTVAHLKKAHAIAPSAHQPMLLHAADLGELIQIVPVHPLSPFGCQYKRSGAKKSTVSWKCMETIKNGQIKNKIFKENKEK